MSNIDLKRKIHEKYQSSIITKQEKAITTNSMNARAYQVTTDHNNPTSNEQANLTNANPPYKLSKLVQYANHPLMHKSTGGQFPNTDMKKENNKLSPKCDICDPTHHWTDRCNKKYPCSICKNQKQLICFSIVNTSILI